jgi:hypothetical protein
MLNMTKTKGSGSLDAKTQLWILYLLFPFRSPSFFGVNDAAYFLTQRFKRQLRVWIRLVDDISKSTSVMLTVRQLTSILKIAAVPDYTVLQECQSGRGLRDFIKCHKTRGKKSPSARTLNVKYINWLKRVRGAGVLYLKARGAAVRGFGHKSHGQGFLKVHPALGGKRENKLKVENSARCLRGIARGAWIKGHAT